MDWTELQWERATVEEASLRSATVRSTGTVPKPWSPTSIAGDRAIEIQDEGEERHDIYNLLGSTVQLGTRK